MQLTDEQSSVAKSILADVRSDNEQVTTMGGLAGTGKSTVVSYLRTKLPNFAVCAFTGKAANVLRKKGIETASTIHSLIYQPQPHEDGGVTFDLKPQVECDGFLVDEASMLSGDLFDDLCSFKKPIVLIGDHGQLEPVGNNPNLMMNPKYRLETIHRYAGELAHFANWVRQGRPANQFKGTGAVQVIRPYHVTPARLVEMDQIICRYNKTRVERNNQVRQRLGYTNLLHVGERVMCLRNNRQSGLFNGLQGKVTKVYKTPNFDFEAADRKFEHVRYDKSAFGQEKPVLEFIDKETNPFDYAYCITCHKAQGDEFNTVLVIEQRSQHGDHNRWAYTAATRAKEKLFWAAAQEYRRPDENDWF